MDLVQDLKVDGPIIQIREVLEAILRRRGIVKLYWSDDQTRLTGRTGWSVWLTPQTITVTIKPVSEDRCLLAVASETLQLFDMGHNRANISWIVDSLGEHGYLVSAASMRRSWRRASRP